VYRNLAYIPNQRVMRLYTWDEEGNRIETDCPYRPYFYSETNNNRPDGISLYGTKLRKHFATSELDRRKKIEDLNDHRIYENISPYQQFLVDRFWEVNETDEFQQFPLKIWFFDIETYSPDEFPKPEEASHMINVITIYDTVHERYYTWGINPYEPETDDVTYYHCKSEGELLQRFLDHYCNDRPDILSGWNSEIFDIPYVINRVRNILGEDATRLFSPVHDEIMKPIYQRVYRGNFGQQTAKYVVEGVSMLDYLDVYKTFSMGMRDSYKLDNIAHIELGENKVDIGDTNLAELSINDWKKFVDYNIHDVRLLVRLDEKLMYMDLARMLSYIGLTPFNAALGTISTVNGRAIVEARKQDPPRVIPTFVKGDDRTEKYEGAYVGEPQRGFQDNVISFDANSLYPSVMVTLNLSPETKVGSIVGTDKDKVYIKTVNNKDIEMTVGEFTKWCNKNEICVTRAKKLFSQKTKGIFPRITDHFYDIRKGKKAEWTKARERLHVLETKLENCSDNEKQDLLEQIKKTKFQIDQLWIWQFTLKILINRIYGYFGNKISQMGDGDIARSITLTGRDVIKQSNVILRNYIKKKTGLTDKDLERRDPIVYNDTDSSYCTISQLLEHMDIPLHTNNVVTPEVLDLVQDIEDDLNENIEKWARNTLLTKDPRFVFKRESICDRGYFLQKKRYVLHKLDDEGVACNKFKYTGVEVVRTTMPNAIKPYVKKIIEHMIMTEDRASTNEMFEETYDIFKSLPINDIAFVMGIKEYEKYSIYANDWQVKKGTPIHVKSAIYYNKLLQHYGISSKHENITSGDKIRYFYTITPNKFGLKSLGFKYDLPEEFNQDFKIDYEKMFEKIVFSVIDRFYENAGWKSFKPGEALNTDLFDFFKVEVAN
jgi:DNA polymerase elongation subunit (family B)